MRNEYNGPSTGRILLLILLFVMRYVKRENSYIRKNPNTGTLEEVIIRPIENKPVYPTYGPFALTLGAASSERVPSPIYAREKRPTVRGDSGKHSSRHHHHSSSSRPVVTPMRSERSFQSSLGNTTINDARLHSTQIKSSYFLIILSCFFNPLLGIIALVLLNMAESALAKKNEELARKRKKWANGLAFGGICFTLAVVFAFIGWYFTVFTDVQEAN